MKRQNIILLFLLTIFASCINGCTTKAWYEGNQINAKHHCNSIPLSEQEQCLKNINNKTYKEYQQK